MCTKDGRQVTFASSEVKVQEGMVELRGQVRVVLAMPKQDGHLPDEVEEAIDAAGQQIKRQWYQKVMEEADGELALRLRGGKQGQGVVRRGRETMTFKTIFGTVLVKRRRIRHKADGTSEIPSARVWETPRQVTLTAGLREAACDAMLEQSASRSVEQIERRAGESGLIARTTLLGIVHEEGRRLMASADERAEAVFAADGEAVRCVLPVVVESTRRSPPEPEEAAAPPVEAADEPEPDEPERVPVGFPGSGVLEDEASEQRPREVESGWVMVQPDEVKVKAQGCTGRKQLLIYTAVVMTALGTWHFSAETAARLIRQVGGLLAALGVHGGRHRLLFVADGAAWIRQWFEGLAVPGKQMILCWYHLAERCRQGLSLACRGRSHREQVQQDVGGHLWAGRVAQAIEVLEARRSEMKNAKALDELIGYLRRREASIVDYGARRAAGLWITSNRVEKFNDWAISQRCKGRGMDWTPQGALALAAMQAARRNGDLTTWRRTGRLPSWRMDQSPAEAA